MRNLKKFLALVLAMMMTLSLMVTVNASSFDDDEDITKVYAEAVDVLTELGVIKGYGGDDPNEGKFLPKNNITRAEVAAILYRLYTGDVNDDNIHLYDGFSEFTDVGPSQWFTPYVNFCANNGLIQGRGNGKFDPKGNITGYETLVMILRAIGYNDPKEFSSSNWRFKASGYGDRLGLTSNIPAGSLGASATREMVSEIMFKGILAPMVKYSPLTLYTTDLLVDAAKVNEAAGTNKVVYAKDVPNTLMYQTFKIVGKRTVLGADAFGRPLVEWVTDNSNDTVEDGSKYIPNFESAYGTGDHTSDGKTPDAGWADTDLDKTKISLAMTPVKVYTDAIDECHLTKDINNDNSIWWNAIDEVLNGKALTAAMVSAADTTGAARGNGKLDATHTTTKYIGATGRTTEIYKLDEKVGITKADGTVGTIGTAGVEAVNKWIFVYVDTLLGEVTATAGAIKDTAGHVIKEATATVKLGNGDGAATLVLSNKNSQYTKGDLILIQTPNGNDSALDFVEAPEKAPLTPIDVPIATAEFPDDDTCVLLSTPAKVVTNVTINATVGARNAKMGIIASDGTTYMASNSFLAARVDENHKTVLTKWYDGPDTSAANHYGINNSMIGRTFNLALDHHGYIIGMDEVVSSSSDVGIITGFDSKRVGAGKYVTTVEAFMEDGTTKSFDVVGLADGKGVDDAAAAADYRYWVSATEADEAWAPTEATPSGDGSDGGYGNFIGMGTLVRFANITMSDGGRYWLIDEYASGAAFDTEMAAGTKPEVGVVKGDVVENLVATGDNVLTGVTSTLTKDPEETDATRKLDDNSVIFVAEYEYNYNTKPGENEGSNTNKTYKVYKGFKNMPTIVTEDEGNILFQEISGGYVLVYAKDTEDNYIIKDQAKITVDDSYLILSRGATYADHSEYNVLKNGVETTIKVSNNNSKLNEAIEDTMTSNELLLVTGRNSKGYITSVTTVATAAAAGDSVALANVNNFAAGFEIIAKDTTPALENAATKGYGAGVLRIAGTDANGDGTFLTVADDVIVKIVNRDLKVCYDSNMAEALKYANGVDKPGTPAATPDGLLESHNLVYELNELGYVCALYVID